MVITTWIARQYDTGEGRALSIATVASLQAIRVGPGGRGSSIGAGSGSSLGPWRGGGSSTGGLGGWSGGTGCFGFWSCMCMVIHGEYGSIKGARPPRNSLDRLLLRGLLFLEPGSIAAQ
jgi:hypothetical protein